MWGLPLNAEGCPPIPSSYSFLHFSFIDYILLHKWSWGLISASMFAMFDSACIFPEWVFGPKYSFGDRVESGVVWTLLSLTSHVVETPHRPHYSQFDSKESRSANSSVTWPLWKSCSVNKALKEGLCGVGYTLWDKCSPWSRRNKTFGGNLRASSASSCC